MPAINVTVANVDTRTVNTKFGPKPVYTVVGTDGSKVNFNFVNPTKFKVSTGGTYTFTVEEGKYGFEFKEMGGSGSAAEAAGSVASSGSSYRGASSRPFPVPISSGEMAIIRQNALTNAVNALSAVGLGGATDDGAVAERIIALAYQFAEFSSGQREVRVADEMGGE